MKERRIKMNDANRNLRTTWKVNYEFKQRKIDFGLSFTENSYFLMDIDIITESNVVSTPLK